ncbi:MAG: FecR domain-containing protein [Candidatus Rokubacteria bacterium]|nr:FecR domain-containing protein [Candidatus Rokubacteria bacterium]
MLRFLHAAAALSVTVILWPTFVLGQPVKAGVVATLEGTATAKRVAVAQPVSLKFKDDVFLHDRIATGERSLARVLLGGKALVTVRELSVLSITEVPGRATVELEAGKVAVTVARERMRPGEAIEIRTGNAVAAVRGTVVVAEVSRASAQVGAAGAGIVSGFYVLSDPTGQGVAVTQLDPVTRAPIGPPAILAALQGFSAAGRAPGKVSPIPPGQLAQVMSGLQAQSVQHSQPANQGQMATQAIETAVTLVNALIGTPTSGATPAPELLVAPTSVGPPPVPEPSIVEVPIIPIVASDATPPPPIIPASPGPCTGCGTILPPGSSVALAPGEPLVTFGTGTFTSASPDPLVLIDSSAVTGSSASLIPVGSGTAVSLAGPALDVTAPPATPSAISGVTSLLDVSGSISSSTLSPFIELDPTTVTTSSHFISIASGGSLSLAGPLFEDRESALTATGLTAAGNFLDVAGALGSTTTEPLMRFTSSKVTTGLNFARVTGPPPAGGANVSIVGSLVKATGSTLVVGSSGAGGAAFEPAFGPRLGGALDGDDRTAPVAFGFAFPFQGSTYTGGFLSTNGFISLGTDNGQGCCNADVPALLAGFPRIAAVWYDLYPPVGNGIHLNTFPGRAVITFDSVAEFCCSGSNTFQFQLLSDGRIVMIWGVMTSPALVHVSLVGVSPGGGVSDPGGVNFSAAVPFSSGAVGTVYELFPRGSFDLAGGSIVFTPNGLGGWDVSGGLISDAAFLALESGAVVRATGVDLPLVELVTTSLTSSGLFLSQSGASLLSIEGPLLSATDSPLTLPSGLARIHGGSRLVSSSLMPLVFLDGGSHSIATAAGTAMFDLSGTATAGETADGVALTLGTERPLQTGDILLEASGATVTGEKVVKVDTALLEASAPLVKLVAGSALTSAVDAVDLSLRAKVTSLGPLLRLDASTMTVTSGAAVNVAGGSLLRVTGDLIQLSNGSTLTLLSGPILNVAGGSVVNISGALLGFNGTGGNAVNVTNALCAPCTSFSGIPVALTGGALASNVSIGPSPIRNPTLGSLALSGSSAAAIRVDGATSRLTITAP